MLRTERAYHSSTSAGKLERAQKHTHMHMRQTSLLQCSPISSPFPFKERGGGEGADVSLLRPTLSSNVAGGGGESIGGDM